MKIHKNTSIKDKLCIATTLGVLLIGAMARADGFTEISGDADFYYYTRLLYNQTISMANDTNTTINLADFDSSTLLPGQTLDSVRVNVKVLIDGAEVKMDNDSNETQVGTARVLNQVNSYSGPNTLNDSFGQIIETADMQLNASQTFNLGATTGDFVGAFDETNDEDYGVWSPVLEAGDGGVVNSLVYASTYVDQGGSISFTINSTYTTSATFSGSDGYFQGNTPTGTFFAEVEYIIIPELNALALATITLGGFGGIALLRRRKLT